jgi:hypothetical protein
MALIVVVRSKHGALLDVELLAAIYVELTTTRQAAPQLESICFRCRPFRRSSERCPGIATAGDCG